MQLPRAAPKMPAMLSYKAATMTQRARSGEPFDPPRQSTPPPAADDDRSWHNSSFELAQGLEVVEIRGDFGALMAEGPGAPRATEA